jgi:predicted nucleotidyltransferase
MANPTFARSVFRFPLTAAFAGEGGVRLLRELAQYGGPLSPRALADRTALTVQGTRRALKRLVALGLVATVGTTDRLLYRLNPDHPLTPALAALFAAEAARVDAVFRAVRTALDRAQLPVLAAWVYGSVARGEDTVASDLDVAVVFDVASGDAPRARGARVRRGMPALESALDALRDELALVERGQHVTLSIVGLSRDDVARLSRGDPWWMEAARDAIPITGPAPAALATRSKVTLEHARIQTGAGE